MKNRKNKKGFTIVELVIVIGVIGILSAILIPTFVSLTAKADQAALKSNLANAYSMYAADAADGKVGDNGAALAFYGQDKVLLSKTNGDAADGYVYTTDGWSTVASAKTGYTLVANAPTYLDYYVFFKA